MWREFGLERPSSPRYEGLKGIYWRLFSEKRRKEDFEKYGTCISCGKRVNSGRTSTPDISSRQAAADSRLSFILRTSMANASAEGLDKRYGAGTAERLKEMYNDAHFKGKITKEWGQVEYRARINALLAL